MLASLEMDLLDLSKTKNFKLVFSIYICCFIMFIQFYSSIHLGSVMKLWVKRIKKDGKILSCVFLTAGNSMYVFCMYILLTGNNIYIMLFL